MTAPVPPVDLDQLETALAAATPGPWGWNDVGLWNNGWTELVAPHDQLRAADAAAIVAAVNAAPQMAAELRAIRAERDTLRRQLAVALESARRLAALDGGS